MLFKINPEGEIRFEVAKENSFCLYKYVIAE